MWPTASWAKLTGARLEPQSHPKPWPWPGVCFFRSALLRDLHIPDSNKCSEGSAELSVHSQPQKLNVTGTLCNVLMRCRHLHLKCNATHTQAGIQQKMSGKDRGQGTGNRRLATQVTRNSSYDNGGNRARSKHTQTAQRDDSVLACTWREK